MLAYVMAKYWLPAVVLSIFVVLIGCGGSSSVSSGSVAPVGGASLSQFQATLPDGSVMELEVFSNDSLNWTGDYAVSAQTGPYAYQSGSFDGTIVGDSVMLNCDNDDGTSFTMTGTANGDLGFQLTRSDIPGTVLTFTSVAPPKKKASADVSFTLNTNGANGRCTLSDQPYSNSNGMTEYRGTWQSCKVTFWAYSTGYASIVVYINDFAIDNVIFASYRLSDFTTVTKTANSANLSIYNPTSKVVMRFGGGASVSP